jgi:hypothetical protein
MSVLSRRSARAAARSEGVGKKRFPIMPLAQHARSPCGEKVDNNCRQLFPVSDSVDRRQTGGKMPSRAGGGDEVSSSDRVFSRTAKAHPASRSLANPRRSIGEKSRLRSEPRMASPLRFVKFTCAIMFLRFCHGLLVTRWSLLRPEPSPPFLPAVYLREIQKLNASGVMASDVCRSL